MSDTGCTLGAEATLAGAHAEANLTTNVIKLTARQSIHCVFEHLAGDQFAFADDLIVAGGRVLVLDVV